MNQPTKRQKNFRIAPEHAGKGLFCKSQAEFPSCAKLPKLSRGSVSAFLLLRSSGDVSGEGAGAGVCPMASCCATWSSSSRLDPISKAWTALNC